MNERLMNKLVAYNISKGYGITEQDIIETVTEANRIWEHKVDTRRYYEEYEYVVDIEGVLVMYDGYNITGDSSMSDMGLSYDINTFCEVEKKEKVSFVYLPIKD